MNQLLDKTLSQIVTENYQAAIVFEKYGLDYCCRGKRRLDEACHEKQIDEATVITELNALMGRRPIGTDLNALSLTELAENITRVHHSYIRQTCPQIYAYLTRVALKHGDRFPYMKEVHRLFGDVQRELSEHMLKEEKILFPRIKQLELFEKPHNSMDFLQAPIDVMEEEHENEGEKMASIRSLTNNYQPAEDACTTHRIVLASLKAFEEDLHQHVHLENNILFPKALASFRRMHTEPIY